MGDVLTNLVQLAYVSALEVAVLQVIFDTPIYQSLFGKGKTGQGSKYFSHAELRPWIAMGLGVLTAYLFHLTALTDGLGINLEDLLKVSGESAVHFDRILTGIAIGGGSKTIKNIAKNFASTRKDLQKTLG